ncbi:MAG: hypothetical protein KatS3mg008_1809 [Acidimicrobiales bacterium]|nr:MAG: hypothetical protein KatS3mg008_1809 [Acidimicrobiales bacterium]
MAVARGRAGFRTRITATRSSGEEIEVEVANHGDGVIVRVVDQAERVGARGGAGEAVSVDSEDSAQAASAVSAEFEDMELSDERVIEILTDAQVLTGDIVAIFASVGAEALWANDAFASHVPVREEDRVWLIDLLDEQSRANYEVNALPALVQYGRWHGRLTIAPEGVEPLPVDVSLVAHRDESGDIEAVSMVARDLRRIVATDRHLEGSNHPAALLVESDDDLLVVVDRAGVISYASPAFHRLLGLDDGVLVGTRLVDRVHLDDQSRCDFAAIAEPADEGIPPIVELRIQHDQGTWRYVEILATDLSENPSVGGIVLKAKDVSERRQADARLAERAYTDPLTLLPNRMRLLDRIQAAIESSQSSGVPFAVVLFDVDRFDELNREYGHASADEVLRQVGRKIAEFVDDPEWTGRLGGDRFVVVLRDISDVDDAIRAGESLLGLLNGPVRAGTRQVPVSVSGGLALWQDGQDVEQVLSDADAAVGAAKEQGGGRLVLMTGELRATARRRDQVVHLLRRAIDEEDGVQVHFQPIFDVATRRVVAAEALLRVHDDEGALLTPAAFLDAAETTGLIRPISDQVLRITCRQIAEWVADGDPNTPGEVSVNVSPRQLAERTFADSVRVAVEVAGIEPSALTLEITESLFIARNDEIDRTVHAIRDLGVRFGLDDFGAGHSSLGFLKRFPLDFVKIDKGLVSGLGTDDEDAAIVRATVELAHNLGLTVVAVGVETDEQLEFLELLECDRVQGFYFLPAVPAEQFSSRVAELRVGG